MELLLLTLSAILFLVNTLYLHAFAFFKTVGLLFKLNDPNKGQEVEIKEILYMIVYWIVFVSTSFLQHCWGLSSLRVIFLTAVLSSQFDLKKKIYDELFTGDLPKFEQYLSIAKDNTVEFFNTMKKI